MGPKPATPSPFVDPWAPEPLPPPEAEKDALPPPSAPASRKDTRNRTLLIAGIAGLGLIVGVGWAMNRPNETGARTALPVVTATVTSSPTPAATSKAPAPTPKPKTAKQLRAESLATLNQLVASDAQKDPIRGQWVAQLASKFEGVVDKSQQATPFTVPQILAEVDEHRRNADYGDSVRVVLQGDWGDSTPGARPLWVTFADISRSSRDEVVAWCESRFPQRGEALLNVCYPREMRRK